MDRKAVIQLITPEIAAKMLEKNISNRTISPKVVNQYAKDMANNKWSFSNDTIDFDKEENLINGQHRLSAIIKSGIPQEMTIIYGAEPNINMDRPRVRSAKDNLEIFSTVNPALCQNNIIAMCNYILFRNNVNAKSQYVLEEFMKENEKEIMGYIKDVGIGDKVKGSKTHTATVMAAFFMAYYNKVSTEVLKKCRIAMATGEYAFDGFKRNKFWPMVPLKNKIENYAGRDRAQRDEMFLRTQYAIYCVDTDNQYKRLPYRIPEKSFYKINYKNVTFS